MYTPNYTGSFIVFTILKVQNYREKVFSVLIFHHREKVWLVYTEPVIITANTVLQCPVRAVQKSHLGEARHIIVST